MNEGMRKRSMGVGMSMGNDGLRSGGRFGGVLLEGMGLIYDLMS